MHGIDQAPETLNPKPAVEHRSTDPPEASNPNAQRRSPSPPAQSLQTQSTPKQPLNPKTTLTSSWRQQDVHVRAYRMDKTAWNSIGSRDNIRTEISNTT